MGYQGGHSRIGFQRRATGVAASAFRLLTTGHCRAATSRASRLIRIDAEVDLREQPAERPYHDPDANAHTVVDLMAGDHQVDRTIELVDDLEPLAGIDAGVARTVALTGLAASCITTTIASMPCARSSPTRRLIAVLVEAQPRHTIGRDDGRGGAGRPRTPSQTRADPDGADESACRRGRAHWPRRETGAPIGPVGPGNSPAGCRRRPPCPPFTCRSSSSRLVELMVAERVRIQADQVHHLDGRLIARPARSGPRQTARVLGWPGAAGSGQPGIRHRPRRALSGGRRAGAAPAGATRLDGNVLLGRIGGSSVQLSCGSKLWKSVKASTVTRTGPDGVSACMGALHGLRHRTGRTAANQQPPRPRANTTVTRQCMRSTPRLNSSW